MSLRVGNCGQACIGQGPREACNRGSWQQGMQCGGLHNPAPACRSAHLQTRPGAAQSRGHGSETGCWTLLACSRNGQTLPSRGLRVAARARQQVGQASRHAGRAAPPPCRRLAARCAPAPYTRPKSAKLSRTIMSGSITSTQSSLGGAWQRGRAAGRGRGRRSAGGDPPRSMRRPTPARRTSVSQCQVLEGLF